MSSPAGQSYGRDPYSVVRSIARHTALILGDDWNDVRPAELEGSFKRPFALVEWVAGQTVGGSAMLKDISMPITVSAYPRADHDADESWRQAMLIADQLHMGFTSNLFPPGEPFRVPLYNYADVPMDASTQQRGYCDYLRLSGLTVNPIKDPDDRRLWTIAVDFRCGYRSVGRIPYEGSTTGPITEEVTWTPDELM